MIVRQVTDRSIAKNIFTQGLLSGDKNSKNYSLSQFELGWDKEWKSFFVLYDNDKPVSFCAIRDYGEYVRIFDRYYVFPKYRNNSLKHDEKCKMFINELINKKYIGSKIPFFSIEHKVKRPAILKAVESVNAELPADKHFHTLDGLYETVPNSWQNIAIQKPATTINLRRQ